MARPTFGFPCIGNSNAINYAQIASGIRSAGYASGASLPAADYDEIHNEIDQWIEYFDSMGNFVQLTGGTAVAVVGTPSGVSIQSAYYSRIGQTVHLEILIKCAGMSSTNSMALTLPSIVSPQARYYPGANPYPIFTSGGQSNMLPLLVNFSSATQLNLGFPYQTTGDIFINITYQGV